MRDLLVQFPGAQRALFRKYHIGGCSSCGFAPDETLAGVCARNDNLNVEEVIDHIVASHEADDAMQIEPQETKRAESKRQVSMSPLQSESGPFVGKCNTRLKRGIARILDRTVL